jgi:cytochrome oxidase Cu insertion factor (SCO1/SenC/PrrC family)
VKSRLGNLALAVTLTFGGTAAQPVSRVHGQEAAPQPPPLLDAINGFVDRLEQTFENPMAPDFSAVDLYGNRMSMRDLRGRIVVMSFVDQKNEEEARAWLSEQSMDYMGDPDLVFLNVLYPGRIPFIVSRGNAADSIRQEVDRYLDETWRQLDEKEKQAFRATSMRWLVDWKRELQRRYNVTRDRMNIVIVDAQGRIREIVRNKTPATVARLKELISELKNGQAAVPKG